MRKHFRPGETAEEKLRRLEDENRDLKRQVEELTRARDLPLPQPTDWPDSHRPPAMPPTFFL